MDNMNEYIKKHIAKDAKNVLVIATGGTVEGVGESGRQSGYRSGEYGAERLINALGNGLPNIIVWQYLSKDSCDITLEDEAELARLIDSVTDENIKGIVVLHGTDTLEEAAYLHDLVLNTSKPVVFTGSMRPVTALSYDGEENIASAVRLAASDEAKGMGVLVCFSSAIISARDCTKVNKFRVSAFDGGENGLLGYVRDEDIIIYSKPLKPHTFSVPFTYDMCTRHSVGIVDFYMGCDTKLLKTALSSYDAVVINGAGACNMSEAFLREIIKSGKIAVASSRVVNGVYLKDERLSDVIPTELSAVKARLLLQLALCITKEKKEIEEIFGRY